MKAGKENKGPQFIELKGKVIRKKFGIGSKSEHDAIYLESDKGTFVLRLIGGNPFSNPGLNKFIGKNVIASGMIDKHTFMANALVEVKD